MPPESPPPESSAESAYEEYRRRCEAGEDLDFERYCSERPELQDALRVLHSAAAARSSQHATGSRESLVQAIRREFHLDADPTLLLDADPPPGTRTPALDRITCLGPSRRYLVRGEVARGGMGVIYEVRDDDLNRSLAMKAIACREQGTRAQELLTRFLDEAQITGQLEHPGVVPVHDLGVDAEGRLFFTMRLVRGRDLSTILHRRRDGEEEWTETRLLGILVQVCEALAYAHAKGVIHRDVKPSNVMVGRFGETYIMDWGLARVMRHKDRRDLRFFTGPFETVRGIQTGRQDLADSDPHSPLMTRDGSVVGTPAYMPPEQAEGRIDDLDPRSDVYSVGAMLYEILAGHPPYVPGGATPTPRAVLAAVLNGPPEPLHRLRRDVPAELAAICEKAMSRHMGERYPSTLEVAEDLRRYLENRVVLAYRTGPVAEFRKWVTRNRGTAVAASGAVLMLLASLVTIVALQKRANNELKSERDAKQEALELAERRTTEVLQLSDAKRLADYRKEAEALWPAYSHMIPALEAWLDKARKLALRLPEHRAHLLELRSLADGQHTTGAWSFADTGTQWWHDTLASLVDDFLAFVDENPHRGTIASVEKRLDFARRVHQLASEASEEWDRAIASIRDPTECPLYGGLVIDRQEGLVPLWRDSASGLWEFLHLQTGEAPERNAAGMPVMTAESGIVLVLLPGGTFRMGAVRPGPDNPPGSPNTDRFAEPDEGPVRDVVLDPFFISKYEMTQEQWERFVGTRPSIRNSPLEPVENVSWYESRTVLRQLGLRLPTEARWEYAARGGTTTIWWTGNEVKSLQGAGNLADLTVHRSARSPHWEYEEELDDGYFWPSPVGIYRPNPFGLHDVVGNVGEWCRDGFSRYTRPLREGDGEQLVEEPIDQRVHRGGTFTRGAKFARSADRYALTPENRDAYLGLRPARLLSGARR